MTKENFTSINVVLDKSGSMSPMVNDTIGGFNTFLKEQKAIPGEAVFTLAMFSNKYDLVYDCVPLSEVKDLDESIYKPGGTTALLDAIGRTVSSTGAKLAAMNEEDRPSKVIFLIMTDGEENSSCEFAHDKIMEMIGHQKEKYSWEFVFIGANQDAIKGGARLGISASHSYNYSSTSVGTKAVYGSMSKGLGMYRTAKVGASFNMADPLDTMKDLDSNTTQVGLGPIDPTQQTTDKDSK